MFQMFYPNERKNSTYDIEFQKLYEQGYRGVIFDIDNTLVEHGADADERAEELFKQLKQIGMRSCLLSNNKKERVERFNKTIGTNYVYDAHKPGRTNYRKAMELMNTEVHNTLFVGDQLFTDVYGARRTGLYSILVEPISPKEEIQIVLKRYLERIVLFFYNRR